MRFIKRIDALTLLPRALALVWHAARGWTLAWLLLLTAQGVLPIATVYLARELVNRLVALARAPDAAAMPITFALVALFAALWLTAQALRALSDWVRAAQAELAQDHIADLIHVQATALDLSFYDAPAYYDMLHRARVDALNRPVALLENLGALFQNGITLVAMAIVLLPFGGWLPLALVVSTAPALVVAFYYTLRQHQWRVRTTAEQRRTHYFDWVLTVHDAAAELRLFGLGDHFRGEYQALRGKLRGEQLQLLRGQAFAEIAAGTFALGVTGAVMVTIVWDALQAHITLGDLALLYQAFTQGQGLMQTALGNASQVYANTLFLENLFAFLALEPKVREPARADLSLRGAVFATKQSPMSELEIASQKLVLSEAEGTLAMTGGGIRFENVRFRYPDSARDALADFNLEIPAGQIVALVGANGAGKSTVVKLLCRFYDPTQGRVLLDGRDIRELPLEDLRGAITVLFQEPVRYHETAARNIAYGEWCAAPDDARVREAARAGGADEIIARLPKGYAEVLGKWFGGAELSVGEWQRIALARAFLRQAPIIALDEPTSAMDSWAEADWMARFRGLVDGRAALIITHRFTTAMQADVIHVMEQGRIVESGTHAELTTNGGRYAESWRRQMDPRILTNAHEWTRIR